MLSQLSYAPDVMLVTPSGTVVKHVIDDSNAVRRSWKPAALPGAMTYESDRPDSHRLILWVTTRDLDYFGFDHILLVGTDPTPPVYQTGVQTSRL